MRTEAQRIVRREKKRRRRERFYRAGLDCLGRPRQPGSVVLKAGAVGTHPADCLCFDCLYPETQPEPRAVPHRVLMGR